MDGTRFDQLTRSMATRASRRSLLKGMMAAFASTAFGDKVLPMRILAAPTISDDSTSHSQNLSLLEVYALGDSVASGHGLWDDGAPCHRSTESYPFVLSEQLQDALPDIFVNFPENMSHLFACSGSSTGGSGPNDLNGQIDHLISATNGKQGYPTLVTITSGMNDIWGGNDKLATLAQEILTKSDDEFEEWLGRQVKIIEDETYDAIARILDIGPNVSVTLSGYYNPINPSPTAPVPVIAEILGAACAIQNCYDKTNRLITTLNDALARAVNRVGQDRVQFDSSMYEAFKGHESTCGYVPRPDTWVQKFVLDSGSNSLNLLIGDCFHPNAHGAQAIASQLASPAVTAVQSILPSSSRGSSNIETGCGNGLSVCGSVCVDLAIDQFNCGQCGRACTSGICTNGSCSGKSACRDPFVLCDSQCRNLQTSPLNCGSCGNRCNGGACVDGICQDPTETCDEGRFSCEGDCVDLLTDTLHCGDCQTQCGNDPCIDGLCQYTGSCDGVDCDDLTCCAGRCVDLTIDPEHCGACDQDCSGEVCVAGSCESGSVTCESFQTDCDGACVNTWGDPLHCGACHQQCGTGECRAYECSTLLDIRGIDGAGNPITSQACYDLTYCYYLAGCYRQRFGCDDDLDGAVEILMHNPENATRTYLTVTQTPPGYKALGAFERINVPFIPDTTQTIDILFQRGGTIQVRDRDSAGNALPGGCSSFNSDSGAYGESCDGWDGEEDGLVVSTGLDEGVYRVWSRLKGTRSRMLTSGSSTYEAFFIEPANKTVYLSADGSAAVEFVHELSAVVVVRTLGPEGFPLSGAMYALRPTVVNPNSPLDPTAGDQNYDGVTIFQGGIATGDYILSYTGGTALNIDIDDLPISIEGGQIYDFEVRSRMSQCESGQRTCAGTCTTLASDPQNCGFCGHVCESGVCEYGGCQDCVSGQMRCGDTCRDLYGDALNCGNCGVVCPSAECSNGMCATRTCTSDVDCESSQTCCMRNGEGTCIDLTIAGVCCDDDHCNPSGLPSDPCQVRSCVVAGFGANTCQLPSDGSMVWDVEGWCCSGVFAPGAVCCSASAMAGATTDGSLQDPGVGCRAGEACGWDRPNTDSGRKLVCHQCFDNEDCGQGGICDGILCSPGEVGPASRTTPTATPIATCVPVDCAALSIDCGQHDDGCGGTLDCGECCQPASCADLGLPCGTPDDGCGGALDCGPCCAPATCVDLGQTCGAIDDGCGGMLDCGECQPEGTESAGDGTPTAESAQPVS